MRDRRRGHTSKLNHTAPPGSASKIFGLRKKRPGLSGRPPCKDVATMTQPHHRQTQPWRSTRSFLYCANRRVRCLCMCTFAPPSTDVSRVALATAPLFLTMGLGLENPVYLETTNSSSSPPPHARGHKPRGGGLSTRHPTGHAPTPPPLGGGGGSGPAERARARRRRLRALAVRASPCAPRPDGGWYSQLQMLGVGVVVVVMVVAVAVADRRALPATYATRRAHHTRPRAHTTCHRAPLLVTSSPSARSMLETAAKPPPSSSPSPAPRRRSMPSRSRRGASGST